MSRHLLLVEDDASLHRGIEFTLRQEGFGVTGVYNLADARSAAAGREQAFDLIVLDVQLPDGSGFDFCAELRAGRDATPIVFLTASDTELDVVRGLDLGGDDYITKPFRLREFLSRIHAVLRRRGPSPSPAAAADEPALASGNLRLHAAEMRLLKEGIEVALSVTEFRLLSLLMTHPRAVLSKEQILRQLWQHDGAFIDDNTVAVNVRRLREKIEDDPQQPQKIVTVRGAGYKWNG
ncbi:DNA-binding response regulator, OmpR family, contains REC and winged-helix (wHTH) domain [Cohnella sp. OV330]|uniref:response regulator transcription factor n=1 Tax=Cohnella sp. OV330 TaxID=1855288 RepID=UPI0008DEB25F|nr:response regulator transcription factor [Cohnella sp. OV330]SFB59945.1 DNA-binding response regulator, OmpR family, contains REC and winged-helix (wHTH) domain [Cohnella sp. OV330]